MWLGDNSRDSMRVVDASDLSEPPCASKSGAARREGLVMPCSRSLRGIEGKLRIVTHALRCIGLQLLTEGMVEEINKRKGCLVVKAIVKPGQGPSPRQVNSDTYLSR